MVPKSAEGTKQNSSAKYLTVWDLPILSLKKGKFGVFLVFCFCFFLNLISEVWLAVLFVGFFLFYFTSWNQMKLLSLFPTHAKAEVLAKRCADAGALLVGSKKI